MQLQPCTQNWVSLGSANALKKKNPCFNLIGERWVKMIRYAGYVLQEGRMVKTRSRECPLRYSLLLLQDEFTHFRIIYSATFAMCG